MLHRAEELLVSRAYFDSIPMPRLWRGAVRIIPGAGHAPQSETPQAFDAFVGERYSDARR